MSRTTFSQRLLDRFVRPTVLLLYIWILISHFLWLCVMLDLEVTLGDL